MERRSMAITSVALTDGNGEIEYGGVTGKLLRFHQVNQAYPRLSPGARADAAALCTKIAL
jgi:hypothetical protein